MTLIKLRLLCTYRGVFYLFSIVLLGIGATLAKEPSTRQLKLVLQIEWLGLERVHLIG